jgi:hypothetical protein
MRLKNSKTGETVETASRDGYEAKDGWRVERSKPKADPHAAAENERKRQIRALGAEGRFDELMAEIEDLKARLIALEHVI